MKTFHSIIVLCTYCKKLISTKDGCGVSGTSLGICQPCLDLAKSVVYGWIRPNDSTAKLPAGMEKLHQMPATPW